ncbi:MAG TPA: hypothetical protein VKU01_34840 [Bryobacteraceae bacterium]|nr:hypothetical protein [Bryobacteraceae bacterium]
MLPLLLIVAAIPDWVPARWHSADVKSLQLLNETPINCLLLERTEWSAGFAKAAKERGIATLGVVRPGADALEQARKPTTLGLDGVVLEGDFESSVVKALQDSKIPTIELPSRAGMRFSDTSTLVYGSHQGLWPGIQVEENGSAKSAPSGAPWIDTNTGFLRFVRAATDKPVWIANVPPANMVIPVQRYIQAIGDAAITGSHWVLALDGDFNKRLLAREPGALADWKRIGGALSFYESHKEWRSMHPHGQLALIQDADSGALLSGSVLDMIAVKNAPVQPVPTAKLKVEAMKDAKMAVDVDPQALSPAQKDVLKAFTRAGGTLLSAPPGWTFPMPKDGSITVAKDDFKKLDEIWKEVNGMVGHTNLGARLFNVSSMLSTLVAPAEGKQVVLQLVNYSDFPVESITAHVLGTYKHARLYVPGAEPKDLAVYEVEGGTGVDIDKLDVIGSIILE